MTATVKIFDMSKNDSTSTSATAIIDEFYPIPVASHFVAFSLGNTGIVINIPVE